MLFNAHGAGVSDYDAGYDSDIESSGAREPTFHSHSHFGTVCFEGKLVSEC